MAATEIYICRAGQSLNEAKVEYSSTIDDRDSALSDAESRCRISPAIAKVVYYRVSEEGDFRVFCSYTNPNPPPLPGANGDDGAKQKKKKRRKKPPPKKTLWQRIKKTLWD